MNLLIYLHIVKRVLYFWTCPRLLRKRRRTFRGSAFAASSSLAKRLAAVDSCAAPTIPHAGEGYTLHFHKILDSTFAFSFKPCELSYSQKFHLKYVWSRHTAFEALTQPFFRLNDIFNLK